MSYATRILASTVEAATPKQLDIASQSMFALIGPSDKQKDKGGGKGILTWKASNPEVKKFKGLKGASLEYDGQELHVDFLGLNLQASGKNWVGIRRELKAMLPDLEADAKTFVSKFLRTRATNAQ